MKIACRYREKGKIVFRLLEFEQVLGMTGDKWTDVMQRLLEELYAENVLSLSQVNNIVTNGRIFEERSNE